MVNAKKNAITKYWLIAGTVGVISVVIALFAAFYLLFWSKPDTKDFEAAQVSAEELRDSSNKLTMPLQDYVTSAADSVKLGKTLNEVTSTTAKQKQELLNKIASHEQLVEKFDDQKVTKDAEVRKAFDAFRAKDERYVAYIRNYSDSYPRFQMSYRDCVKIYQVTQEGGSPSDIARRHESVSKPCLEDLSALSSSKVGPIATYAKEFKSIIDDRQTVFDRYATGAISENEQGIRLTELSLRAKNNDPLSGISKLRKEVSITNEADALKNVLQNKAKEA